MARKGKSEEERPEWESNTTEAHKEWDNRLLLTCGNFEIRRPMAMELGSGHFRAWKICNWKINQFKPKGVRELHRRMSVEDFYYYGGVSDESVIVWCLILKLHRIDSDAWIKAEGHLDRDIRSRVEEGRKRRKKIRKPRLVSKSRR